MAERFRIPAILQLFLFFIPVNIYLIGNDFGAGIQWFFLRYQQTTMGNGLVFLSKELGYIANGTLTGKSIFSIFLWSAGVCLVIVSTMLVIYSLQHNSPIHIKKAAFLNIGAAVAFLISVFIQYGPLLHGPAGVVFPLGIPVILVIGFWQLRLSRVAEDPDDDTAITEESVRNTDESPEKMPEQK
jgi:hypothetical protein